LKNNDRAVTGKIMTVMSGTITELRDGNATIAVFRSELKHLNETNVAIIEQKLMELIETLPFPILILDMQAIEFFGSSFIETLFRVWKKLNTHPAAQFGISGLQPYCREVLEITHLDKIWPLFKTNQAAVKSLGCG
jgi:anti-anti-sigma factor